MRLSERVSTWFYHLWRKINLQYVKNLIYVWKLYITFSKRLVQKGAFTYAPIFSFEREESHQKRRLLSFESNISSWDCFKQRKGAFSIRRLHDFMTNVGVFDDILKIEHVLKWLMVFSKGAFSLKLCLRCQEHIPNPSDVFGWAFLVH